MSRHGKSLNSKPLHFRERIAAPRVSCFLCPTVLLFTAEIKAISGIVAKIQCKSWEPTELTLSRDAHHSFLLPQGPAANVWNEEEVGIRSEQQNKHMIWIVSLPSHKQLKREILLVKGKKQNTFFWDHLGNSASFMFSSTAINLSTSTPNSLTRSTSYAPHGLRSFCNDRVTFSGHKPSTDVRIRNLNHVVPRVSSEVYPKCKYSKSWGGEPTGHSWLALIGVDYTAHIAWN